MGLDPDPAQARGMSWTPARQAMLRAMGYSLYARPESGLLAPAPGVPAEAGSGRATTAAEAGPRAGSQAAPARPPASRAASGTAGGGFERLEAALRRAAHGRELGHVLPPLAELRASPAAKRAFWPVLRALRRLH